MKKSILFIGNSYTYYNDMPETIFTKKAADAGHLFHVTAVTCGGYKLSQFADPHDPEGKRLREVICGKHFDYVVLQDQSFRAIIDKDGFFHGIRDLKTLLGNTTDHFILYATWGRKAGCSLLTEFGLTSEEMTEKLAAAYIDAAERLGMKVAHVGRAFAAHAITNPGVDLYDPDLSHPSEKGSEIAAETILAAILSE